MLPVLKISGGRCSPFCSLTKGFSVYHLMAAQCLFSFVRGSNLFSFSKFNWLSKKESEKMKKSHLG